MSEDSPELNALQQGWAEQHGSLLVVLRRSRGLLQAEVADSVGVPRSVVSNWETATRKPSVDQLHRLLDVLSVQPGDLIPVTRSEAVAEPVSPDLLASAEAAVPDEQVDDLRRFLRQIRIFERLSEAAEIPARRWLSLRRLAEDARTTLQALTGQNATTRNDSLLLGRRLALEVRNSLDLADAPLPSIEALAELCGVHVFRIAFGPTPQERLRAVLLERPELGAVLLLNASLTENGQRLVVAESLARAILQVPGAVVATTAKTSRTATNLDVAATAFAREFALPARAVELDLAPYRHGASGTASDTAVVRAVVETALIYGVPASVVQASAQLSLTPAQTQRIVHAMNLAHLRSNPRTIDAVVHTSWTVTAEDIPQRFLHQLLGAIANGDATISGISDLTGIAEMDLEALLQAAETGPAEELIDVEWSDSWRPDVA